MKRQSVVLCILLLLLLPACLGEPAVPRTPLPGTPVPTLAGQSPLPHTAVPTGPPVATATAVAVAPTSAPVATDTAAAPSAAPPTAPPATATTEAIIPTTGPTSPPPTATTVAEAPSPTAIPQPPSPTPASGQVTLLATGFGSPDDLTIDQRDGTIYFGDFGNGAINRLAPAGGTAHPVVTGIDEPEGIVVLDDGHLIVVEQKTNRLLLVDPASGDKQLLRQLVNNTGQDGVDGLGYDRGHNLILIPDSPNGRVLTMRPDGSDLQVLATGFVRPTGAAVLPDGAYLIADEFGNTLYRLANGRKSAVTTMYQPDDVVVDRQGIAYVNALGGEIYRVDPTTGRRTTLLSGLKLPHGLDVDPQGNLVVAEATRNRIFRLIP